MQLNPRTHFISGQASLRQDIYSAIDEKLAVAENGIMRIGCKLDFHVQLFYRSRYELGPLHPAKQ